MQSRHADLTLDRLTKLYGPARAVDDVSLHIATGEMVAMLGPSGCGKTTTLRMIAGLVRPSAGAIRIGGEDVTRLPVHRRNIGMLFQNYALFPHMSVARNVAFGLEMRRISGADTRRRVAEALELVQLAGMADRPPSALSGGQQQRVALARALVIEPSVLLLDEPLAALDQSLRETMQIELRQLQQRLGITAVMVTHDQHEAMGLADRIVVMRAGRVEQIGTPRQIYDRPVSRFVAGFVGASNFLGGRVQARSGAQANVVSASLSLELDADEPVGATVLIALRPEAVTLHPNPGTPGVNEASGTVTFVSYLGATQHVHLSLDGGTTLLVHRHGPDDGLAQGARVLARWRREDNRLVADV